MGDRPKIQVEQCLEAVEPSAEQQLQTVQRGLQLTEAALGPAGCPVEACESKDQAQETTASQGASGSSEAADRQRWWRVARLRLLQHQERIYTALALMGGTWSPAAFASLRDCTIAEAAASLAAVGRLSALPVLLARHPRALMPSVLDVLGAVPETTDAKQLVPTMRQVAAMRDPPPLPRQPDWAESAATAAELRQAGQYALLLATEPMCAASCADSSGGAGGWRPPTQRQLAAWVCQRAQQVDAATGLLPNAIALLEAGSAALHYSEASISNLLALAKELLSLIKLAASRADGSGGSNSSTWRMDLQQYAKLAQHQRLSLLLGQLGSGDSLADDLAAVVAPFLARLAGSRGSTAGASAGEAAADPQVVLRQALEAESAWRLGWVVRVVQAEARRRAVFSDAAQLAKTAGACCYASGATDAWELLSSMLSAARDALRCDESLGKEERDAAAEGLAAVRGHVSAARLLTKHGLTTPVSTVRDADRAAALRLLRTLLARVSRTRNTESRWVEVWMDVRSIQEHGFGRLSEDDVRAELCRALLRVGQYRLCGSYLQGLQAAAQEQLVLAAGREVFMSASAMSDRAVKQAKECFSLLPASAAAREELAGIAAAEQLQSLGLDLPPLQLQQLRSQVAAGGTEALDQLFSGHPGLAAGGVSALCQLAAALGLPEGPQPLLLRAAAAAHTAGRAHHAADLLLLLASQRYRPAWQQAAAVAQDARCGAGTRQQLLEFALTCSTADQLLTLLLDWQAADSGEGSSAAATAAAAATGAASGDGAAGPWDLFSAQEAAADRPGAWDDQQRWLARQLRLHFISLGRCSSTTASGGFCGMSGSMGSAGGAEVGGEAAALGCLLALGHRGLLLWHKLLTSEQLPRPLGYQLRRRALLLGLTASALLALAPADVDPAGVEQAAAAAQERLAAGPAELLRLAQQQQQQQQQQLTAASRSSSSSSSALQQLVGPTGDVLQRSGSGLEPQEAANGSEASAPAAAPTGLQPAAAALAAAERFRRLLQAAADARGLQRLLPGIDAAAALAGGRESRRRLAVQLAAAAGRPPTVQMGSQAAAAAAAAAGRSSSTSAASSPPQQQHSSRSTAGATAKSAARQVQRVASRKKYEVQSSSFEAPRAAGVAVQQADSGSPAGSAGLQMDAAEASRTLRQALAVGTQAGAPAWEVHLAFLESLLVYNLQQQWGQPGSVPRQLADASLDSLLGQPQQAQQAAVVLAQALLLRVWPQCSSRWPQHVQYCLRLLQRCCEVLAATGPHATDGVQISNETLRALAAASAACCACAQQLQHVAEGIQAKLFVDPLVQLLAALLHPSSTSSDVQCAASADSAAVNHQLYVHAVPGNAAHLAAAVEQLRAQHSILAQAAARSIHDVSTPAAARAEPYPCSGSSVYLALFCNTVSAGSTDAATAAQQARECLLHMAPAHAAAAAAFVVGKGPWPLALPDDQPQPAAFAVAEAQQQSLLESALQIIDSKLPAATGAAAAADAAGVAAGADAFNEALQYTIGQLRQRHALLATWHALEAACPASPQLSAAKSAAASLQQAAPAGGGRDDGAILQQCLQRLLTSACPAAGVLQAAALLQALQQHPTQAPSPAILACAAPDAMCTAQQAVAAAAEAELDAALAAMSGAPAIQASTTEPLSAGDAVQNLFALLRALHAVPDIPSTPSTSQASDEVGSRQRAAAVALAQSVDAVRLLVWRRLQQHAAAYDGAGGAAATDAHLQVLELLGSVGTPGMWPGWLPPAASAMPESSGDSTPADSAAAARAASSRHQRALLFTRTAAALAQEWPEAVQCCRVSAADFGSVEAAEAALLRVAAAAEGPQHLRLLLRLLQEGLAEAFPAADGVADRAAAAACGATGDMQVEGQGVPAPTVAAAAADSAANWQPAGPVLEVAPLHRVWATCLRMLLPFGDLSGVLSALEGQQAAAQQAAADRRQGQFSAASVVPITQDEAEAVLEAADATQGAAAAAAAALLLPYPSLQRARWDRLARTIAGAGGGSASELAASLPGLAPLLLLLVQRRPGWLAELASGGREEQRQLMALLAGARQHQGPGGAAAAYCAPLGGSALTLQMAAAVAAAAHLAQARQYTAAGWAAMQASGTPRLLRLLDSSRGVLERLLRGCAEGTPAAAGAAAAARELAAGACPPGLALPVTAAALLQQLPGLCASALDHVASDLDMH